MTLALNATQSSLAVPYFSSPAPIVTVVDNVGVVGGTPTCSIASGSIFQLGSTQVSCSAKDYKNNSAACTFTVTVVDTLPPVFTCPAERTIIVPINATSAEANWTVPPVIDNVNGVMTPVCKVGNTVVTPANKTVFYIDEPPIICSAIDSSNNQVRRWGPGQGAAPFLVYPTPRPPTHSLRKPAKSSFGSLTRARPT